MLEVKVIGVPSTLHMEKPQECLSNGSLVSFLFVPDAWKSLTDKVQEARSNARLKQLSFAGTVAAEEGYTDHHCRTKLWRCQRAE